MAPLWLRVRHDPGGSPQHRAGAGAPSAGAGSAAWPPADRGRGGPRWRGVWWPSPRAGPGAPRPWGSPLVRCRPTGGTLLHPPRSTDQTPVRRRWSADYPSRRSLSGPDPVRGCDNDSCRSPSWWVAWGRAVVSASVACAVPVHQGPFATGWLSLAWRDTRVSHRCRAQVHTATSRRKPLRAARRWHATRMQAAATSRAPGARPREGLGRACASGASPQLLQASHDRERAFFVDGDTEELAVLIDGPEATVGIPRNVQHGVPPCPGAAPAAPARVGAACSAA